MTKSAKNLVTFTEEILNENLRFFVQREHEEYDRSSLKPLAWMYARLHENASSNNQKILAWSTFR